MSLPVSGTADNPLGSRLAAILGGAWSRRCAGLLFGGSLVASLLVGPAVSQPPSEGTTGGLYPVVPVVPSKLESPSLRFNEASSFIDKMSQSDASFEVVVGRSRTLTLKESPADLPEGQREPAAQPMISVGDPSIADFTLVGDRHIRMLGKRLGVTDLTIVTASGKSYHYEVHVVLDLKLLEARLLQLFPEAHIRLAHLGPKLIVEGQARDTIQLSRISDVLKDTVSRTMTPEKSARPAGAGPIPGAAAGGAASESPTEAAAGLAEQTADAMTEAAMPLQVPMQTAGAVVTGDTPPVEIINLMRVPGPQQVMLQVQVAELNRTALRQIGSDLLFNDGAGTVVGTRLTGANDDQSMLGSTAKLLGSATASTAGTPTTAFGIFEGAGFHAFIAALRRNTVLKLLAEPNLVAMHGHRADFLAGGEFPVPVPQSGAGGGPPTITIEYKKFGVQLAFVPYVLDGDMIRMEVDPEVSSIDFALGTQISGVSVPGLNTRRSHTVVEMREGQTLAIAGLMQVDLAGATNRIPGLGDLPYIGPFFSNNTGTRVEKELIVLVTPHLVEAIDPSQVGPLPGDEVYEPNDLEFYLMGHIEGHTGHPEYRSTLQGEDPFGCQRRQALECQHLQGPHGFSQ